ncbi:EamA family transporter [Candidatus Woesearchaeota archaeon]|nr:EamA family transporter [Candidatus Woesearchaeota archaeon]
MVLTDFWLLFVIVASTGRALSAVMLKILRTKYLPDSFTMVVLQGLIGGFAILLVPFSSILSQPPLLIMIGVTAGLLSMLVYLPFYSALSSEEVSRVSLVFQLSPLIVLLLSALFIGEVMTARSILAFFLVLGGALLVSAKFSRAKLGIGRGLYLGSAAALISAGAVFLLKLAAPIGAFSVFLLIGIGNFIAALALLTLPIARRNIRASIPKVTRAGWLVFLGEYALSVIITGVFFVLAVVYGPVVLVSAIYGSHVVLIFAFAAALTILAPKLMKEELDKRALFQKITALVMVVAGVLLLYL